MKKQELINKIKDFCSINDKHINLEQYSFLSVNNLKITGVKFEYGIFTVDVDKEKHETINAADLSLADLEKLYTAAKKNIFEKCLQNIAISARNQMIYLITDVCRDNGGEIKFKYYNCTVIDDCDGETVEIDICGARLYDDNDLVFITENGADEEDAMAYSMDELYNICLSINNF